MICPHCKNLLSIINGGDYICIMKNCPYRNAFVRLLLNKSGNYRIPIFISGIEVGSITGDVIVRKTILRIIGNRDEPNKSTSMPIVYIDMNDTEKSINALIRKMCKFSSYVWK